MNDVNATLSEQEQVRRAKLQKLVDEGNDPYVKTRFDVNAFSTNIKANFEDIDVRASVNMEIGSIGISVVWLFSTKSPKMFCRRHLFVPTLRFRSSEARRRGL